MTDEERQAVLDELTALTFEIEKAQEGLIGRVDQIYDRLAEER
ncbi:MAG: hypothetical protein SV201_14460 [Pseudomonadota bacterium]|nr:hypothetical protein [Pseudomonadota bacterium]